MGVYLSTPKTEKSSEDGENEDLRYGVSSMQGWRTTMEDAVSSYVNCCSCWIMEDHEFFKMTELQTANMTSCYFYSNVILLFLVKVLISSFCTIISFLVSP